MRKRPAEAATGTELNAILARMAQEQKVRQMLYDNLIRRGKTISAHLEHEFPEWEFQVAFMRTLSANQLQQWQEYVTKAKTPTNAQAYDFMIMCAERIRQLKSME